MQQFFESTIISTFIKYLLSCTPLPTYPTITTDDYMIAGVTYIYKNDILRCIESGRFNGIKPVKYKTDYLYVSDDIVVTDKDAVMKHLIYDGKNYVWVYKEDQAGPGREGGQTVTDDMVEMTYLPVADYEIVGRYEFGGRYPNITKQFISNVHYYDPKTHRTLGDYLRCLRDIKGIDLMGLYNCFDYTIAENISLENNTVQEYHNPKTKVILVPIKFNKTYTIAIECPFPVSVCPVFYDGKNLIKDTDNNSMTDKLLGSFTKYNTLQFISPQTFILNNDPAEIIDVDSSNNSETELLRATKYCAKMVDYEKYLYLAIQLPKSNDSSIVVLEGDYANTANNYVSSAQGIDNLGDPRISNIFRSNLSLLHSNDNTQKPFSDKLIEYLLRYSIDDREYIDENVRYVESAVGYKPDLKNFYSGQWDTNLRYALYKTYMQLPQREWRSKEDILGFVDIDIEDSITRKELKIKTAAERGLKPFTGNWEVIRKPTKESDKI